MTEPLDLDALRALTDAAPPLSLESFRARYEADDNEWWRTPCGDHMNLFDAACEALDAARAEVARLRAVVASVEALCDETEAHAASLRTGLVPAVPAWGLRAALTAAQDAPAPILAAAEVERLRDEVSLARRIIDLDMRLHAPSASTAGCGGGIGGQMMTPHCPDYCEHPKHDADKALREDLLRDFYRLARTPLPERDASNAPTAEEATP